MKGSKIRAMAHQINGGRRYGAGRRLAKLMNVDETTVYRWFSEAIFFTEENQDKILKLLADAKQKYARGGRLKGDQ
jgi:hypothetical protein